MHVLLSMRTNKCVFLLAVQVQLNRGLDFPSLDDVLVDMKLAPEVLELPCPAYFRDERAKVSSPVSNTCMTRHSLQAMDSESVLDPFRVIQAQSVV